MALTMGVLQASYDSVQNVIQFPLLDTVILNRP